MQKVKCYGRQKETYVKPESSFITRFFDGEADRSNFLNLSSSGKVFQKKKLYCHDNDKENINASCLSSPKLYNLSSDPSYLNTPISEVTSYKAQNTAKRKLVKPITEKTRRRKALKEKRKSKEENPNQISFSKFLNFSLVVENLNAEKKKKFLISNNALESTKNSYSANTGNHSSLFDSSTVPSKYTATNDATNVKKKKIRGKKSSQSSSNFHELKEYSPFSIQNNSSKNVQQMPIRSYVVSPSHRFCQLAFESFHASKQNLNVPHENDKILTSTPVGSKDFFTNSITSNLISFCGSNRNSTCRKLSDIFISCPLEKSCEVSCHCDFSLLQVEDEVRKGDDLNVFNTSKKASKLNFQECDNHSECHLVSQQQSRSLITLKTSFNSPLPSKKCYSCLTPNSPKHSLTETTPHETFEDQLSKLLLLCNQNSVKSFSELYDWSHVKVVKIGEGTYGEVFLITRKRTSSVLKVIPVANQSVVSSFQELQNVFSEVRISKCLSQLRNDGNNYSKNFNELKSVYVVNGLYPSALIDAWDSFSEARSTYNIRPDEFTEGQLYVILELEYGGKDLSCFVLKDATEGESVLKQVAISLAIAEEEHLFEHRDLHLGNILVRRNRSKKITYKLRGKPISVQSCGLHVTIIDFTLSRLYESGCVYYNDLANDISLFNQSGDYQFEVYRAMKLYLGNQWHECLLYSNVLWLNFLCVKLKDFSYSRPSKVKHAKSLKNIEQFQTKLGSCECAVDCLIKCEIVAGLPAPNPRNISRLTSKSLLISRKSGLNSKKSIQLE